MVQLQPLEESDQRLVFKMGALAMLCHMSLCTLIAGVVSVSLTLFLRHYIGIFAFVFIAFPGLICVICGFFGCANARQFTFTFDRLQGNFVALAGGARLVRGLNEIRLVYIERECSSGGMFGSDAPTFAATLLFADGCRCRLEGGVSITGSGKGPAHLQEQADKIRQFLCLPQQNLPLLNVSKEKDERAADVGQAEAGLSRWLSCQGIVPRLEQPLLNYDWVELPEGPVRIPGLNDGYQPGGQQQQQQQQQRWARPMLDPALGPVVLGRPQPNPAPRQIQVVVPEGCAGQSMMVMAPDGNQVTVMVPPDMRPGQAMTIQY